jgi:Ulp1 family protease
VGLKKDFKMAVMDVPQQDNTYDCGVYTLQMMKFLAFKTEFPQWEPSHMKMVRLTMIMELGERAIRWKGLHPPEGS